MLDAFIQFHSRLGPWEWLVFFWPFFFFDFFRYVLVDLILVPTYRIRRYLGRSRQAAGRRQLFQHRPLVSVIVPGKNEGRHIGKLVASLGAQTYGNLELIVVDDGSDDNTPVICRKLEAQGLIDMFIRNDVRGGKASAANTALRYARGEYVIHLDADSHLEPHSIETILIPFILDPSVGAVGGDVRVANNDASLATRLQTIEYMKSLSTGRTVSSMLGILRIVAGAHGAFRRDLLERLQGWDVGPGLDGDITVKIRKLGFKIVHEPNAICYTNVPTGFKKLARQRFRWDRSLVRFRLRKHNDVFRPDANFQISNFLSFAENVFFNILLNIRWWVYMLQILLTAQQFMEFIFLTTYLMYLVANFLQFGMACFLISGNLRRDETAQWPYLFLMPIYMGIYLRIVRSYAYVMESLHRVSYLDRWNPWKVSSVSQKVDR